MTGDDGIAADTVGAIHELPLRLGLLKRDRHMVSFKSWGVLILLIFP
jgi:hypothetical protein